jgi:hypothetical protein
VRRPSLAALTARCECIRSILADIIFHHGTTIQQDAKTPPPGGLSQAQSRAREGQSQAETEAQARHAAEAARRETCRAGASARSASGSRASPGARNATDACAGASSSSRATAHARPSSGNSADACAGTCAVAGRRRAAFTGAIARGAAPQSPLDFRRNAPELFPCAFSSWTATA